MLASAPWESAVHARRLAFAVTLLLSLIALLQGPICAMGRGAAVIAWPIRAVQGGLGSGIGVR